MNRRITKTTILMSLAVLAILLFPVALQFEQDETVADVDNEPVAESLPTQSPSPTAALERFSSPVRRYTRSAVNLRAGPSTDFDTVGSLPANTALDVVGKQGDWYRIRVNDREVYVAGWLTRDALSPVSSDGQGGENQETPADNCCELGWNCATEDDWTQGWYAFQNDNCERSSQSAQASSTEPMQSTQPSFSCDCSITCGEMTTCAEAYFQLNDCGCEERDSDGDGTPCESLCD